MRQFDAVRSADEAAPYAVVLQADLLRESPTVVVAPLVLESVFGRVASTLNPVFELGGETLVLSTQELAGVSRSSLNETVASLAGEREAIIAALDLLFTGI